MLLWVAIIGACIGIYYLYKQGKIPWLKGLKGIKMPKMFEPKAETLIEKLKAQTRKEVDKAEKLKSVLEAKTELAKARAENIRLQREIDGVSEKSVEKEKQVAEKGRLDAEKAKPRRL
jgi:uncharacterized protein (DUF342 family)